MSVASNEEDGVGQDRQESTGSDAPIALPARSPRLPRDTTEIRALYQGLEVAVPGGGTMSPACQIERGHLPAA
jgi:hypothetical protein